MTRELPGARPLRHGARNKPSSESLHWLLMLPFSQFFRTLPLSP
jgi:hypothetical protein